MRAYRSTALLAVLAAGVVLTQQACSPSAVTPAGSAPSSTASSGPSSTPSAKPSATPSGPAATTEAPSGEGAAAKPEPGGILGGKRQVVIRPIQEAESIVVVDPDGRLSLTDGEAEHGLFVFTPHNGKFLIKTAKADASGEPSCMGIKHNGSRSLTVEAAPCDTSRAGQLFDIRKQNAKDGRGRPTYSISNQGAFLQVFPSSGLIAEELGDAPLKTTFAFVDNGPSELPALD